MKHFLPFSIFLSTFFSVSAQTTKCDTIHWLPDVKLTWKDFKGAPDKTSPFKALTESGMYLYRSQTNNQMVMKTGTNFMPCTSWTIVSSDSVLRHEQLHFDITEMYRRMFLKKIMQGTFSQKDQRERINSIYMDLNREWQKEEQRYDAETDHGIIQKKQLEWEKRIKEQLQSLEQFTQPELTIILK